METHSFYHHGSRPNPTYRWGSHLEGKGVRVGYIVLTFHGLRAQQRRGCPERLEQCVTYTRIVHTIIHNAASYETTFP